MMGQVLRLINALRDYLYRRHVRRQVARAYRKEFGDMQTAQSHHLQNYDYDADSQTLTVTFTNGSVYQYSGVAFDDYNRLQQTGGSGTAFWAFIRGRYSAAKISGGTRLKDRRAREERTKDERSGQLPPR